MYYLLPFFAAYFVYLYTYRKTFKEESKAIEQRLFNITKEIEDMDNEDILMRMFEGFKHDIGKRIDGLSNKIDGFTTELNTIKQDVFKLKTKSTLKAALWGSAIGGGCSVVTAVIVVIFK